MKKILFLTTLCCFSLVSYAQNQSADNRWAAYGFSVAVEDEAEFVQLMDDYFSKNKTPGTNVKLFDIMHAPDDFQHTHEVVITGSIDSMSDNFSPSSFDEAWGKFRLQVSKLITPGYQAVGSRTMEFGDDSKEYPYQLVHTFSIDSENRRKWNQMVRKLRTKYPRTKSAFATGHIRMGGHDNSNTWILRSFQSYKDFLTDWNDRQAFRKNNPEFVEEQTKMNEDIDYSKAESKLRFMRLLLKQW
jgi:hypothetical protein